MVTGQFRSRTLTNPSVSRHLHLDSLALEWISKAILCKSWKALPKANYGASPNLGAVYIDTLSINEDSIEKDLLIIDAKIFGSVSR